MNKLLLVVLTLCATLARADDDDTRLTAAKNAYREGNFDKALEELAPLLDRDPAKDKNAATARDYAARSLQRRGEDHFRHARIKESVADFDREVELLPAVEASHWQRGISLYYAKEYEKGVKQFELHQTVNPQDVENAVWHFLCAVRAPGGTVDSARKNFIPITSDRRVPMKEVHEMFAGHAKPEDVLKAAQGEGEDAQFYADLYVGLYYEAIGEPKKSIQFIEKAAKNPSAQNQYMGDVARVHERLRATPAPAKQPDK